MTGKQLNIPIIETELDSTPNNANYPKYKDLIINSLKQVIPENFFQLYTKDPSNKDVLKENFESMLPLTSTTPMEEAPANISLIIFFKFRPNAFKFFFELISRWLIPGKRLHVLAMYAADFTMPEFSDQIYNMVEVMIRVETQEELELIQRNMPIVETEARLGVVSSYYARRILEVKGLSSDEKAAMIQEYVAWIASRQPKDFSPDVFTEVQHMLVMCRDSFKEIRGVRHLSRIICVQYLFRKNLLSTIKDQPEKRHLRLKLFQSTISEKKVLGIIVAVNFLQDKEVFEEKHLIKAVQNYIPKAQFVEGSSFFNRRVKEPICTLYLEMEKSDGTPFSKEEIRVLRNDLPNDLEGRIEHLMHPVFMPRNEEEMMRNILALSDQIKFLRDIPQMFITFDEQTHAYLYFTLLIVRTLKGKDRTLTSLFSKSNLEFLHESTKKIGYLRKKYPKEASVFRVKLPKENYLRRDHSIDLYKARQAVVNQVHELIGDVRDFNGGMISKQNELLANVREILTEENVKYNDLLLENFFYSLIPVIMRTVLDPESLTKLFKMLLEAIADGFFNEDNYAMKVRAEPNNVFVMIAAEDRSIIEDIDRELNSLNLSATSLASVCVNVYDIPYIGYILRSDDPQLQRKFCIAIQHAIEAQKV